MIYLNVDAQPFSFDSGGESHSLSFSLFFFFFSVVKDEKACKQKQVAPSSSSGLRAVFLLTRATCKHLSSSQLLYHSAVLQQNPFLHRLQKETSACALQIRIQIDTHTPTQRQRRERCEKEKENHDYNCTAFIFSLLPRFSFVSLEKKIEIRSPFEQQHAKLQHLSHLIHVFTGILVINFFFFLLARGRGRDSNPKQSKNERRGAVRSTIYPGAKWQTVNGSLSSLFSSPHALQQQLISPLLFLNLPLVFLAS